MELYGLKSALEMERIFRNMLRWIRGFQTPIDKKQISIFKNIRGQGALQSLGWKLASRTAAFAGWPKNTA